MAAYDSDSLATISRDGEVPQERFKNASTVQDFARRLVDNDSQRSFKRARVNGLVDGNPPYKASNLREAGRADAANVNWGKAYSYLEAAVGSFYDLFSESPQFINVQSDYGTDEQKEIYSRIISEEANRILREDKTWDYNIQLSQWDMVLHGCGPLMFEDGYQVLPKAFHSGDLKVPEFTKSDTSYWEIGVIQATYYPPELYKFIEKPETASLVGWDVEYTKLVIANAMDIKQQNGQMYDWEFYQQELKNNSLAYYDDSKVCRLVHVFWKEFDQRITHAIVEKDTSVGVAPKVGSQTDEPQSVKYLFKKLGRYSSFQEAVHPMYFSHGNGGYHHSVTGLGVRMYSAMEYQNRLLCNLCDKAFSPKILFKPTTTESAQKFSLARFGDYAVLPGGFDWQQTGVAGLMNDGLAMDKAITDIIGENLSSFRPQMQKDDGNPVTARQINYDASVQGALSKTQFNRYYEQLDMLLTEIYRRMSNLSSTDERAKQFLERCKERGVPTEAISRVKSVKAGRVVGQGSAFMRKQAIDSLINIAGALPEEGRQNLIADKVAAEAGFSAVSRYMPDKSRHKLSNDQQAEAAQWIGLMKIGVKPVITSSQNPVEFSTAFLGACVQAIQSLKAGGNPSQVYQFLNVAAPAAMAHLKRFENDPTLKDVFKQQTAIFKQVAKAAEMLKAQLTKQMQQRQVQSQKTQQAMSDVQIKNLKAKNDIAIKNLKTQMQLRQSEQKHRLKMVQGAQEMALADAASAADIIRNNNRPENAAE